MDSKGIFIKCINKPVIDIAINNPMEKGSIRGMVMQENVWFTADQHFNHANIIELSNRPFKDINEMNEYLIGQWNFCVRQHDRVYILGDLILGGKRDIIPILERLNGHKYLILGNHDVRNGLDRFKEYFIWIKYYKELKVDNQRIVLFHYPLQEWNGSHRGVWHLHGHSHGNLKHTSRNMLDVGVDNVSSYSPINFKQIKGLMERSKDNGE